MKFEMHCHTKEGSRDAFVEVDRMLLELEKKGYNGVLLTDHNSYRGYEAVSKKPEGLVVLRGVEYDTLDGGHVLIILPRGKETEIFTYPGLKIKDTIEVVHKLGGVIGLAHPYAYAGLGFCNTQFREEIIEEIIEEIDFIEVFNSCVSKELNENARLLARLFNKVCFGGSDSHRMSRLGKGYTLIDANITIEDDLIAYIKREKYLANTVGGEYVKRVNTRLVMYSLHIGGVIYKQVTRITSKRNHKKLTTILGKINNI